MNQQNLSSFIWSVADLLRGDYKQSDYGKVILPFTVLRRLDCVLEATKDAVLKEKEKREAAGLNPEPFLIKKSGQLFYNTSPLDMKKLMGDQEVERSAAMKSLMGWVRLHPYNIAQKVQILLVANKFQTGFDQPLLCGMYVDKRLAGIQAVQTLSRLNHCHPGKDKTYVLDFVNDPEEVLSAFKTYYTTATLSAATDPNIVLTLRSKLDGMGFYDDFEMNRVVDVELNPNAKQSQLQAAVNSPEKQRRLLSLLLGPGGLYETLRGQA